jgi:hypothetical protein
MRIRRIAMVLAIGAALALSGCGGSSGGGGGEAAPPSNNWDSMKWDQGSWG